MKAEMAILFVLAAGLAGCSTAQTGNPVKITKEMEEAVSAGILDKTNSFTDTKSAREFEAHKIYGAGEKDGVISVYTYTQYEVYNKGEKVGATGYSTPVLVKLKKENGKYQTIEFKQPEDGSEYQPSIEKMFPKNYAQQALKDTGHIPELGGKIKAQAKELSSEN